MKDTLKYMEQKLFPRPLKRAKMFTEYDDREDPAAIKNLELVHAEARAYLERFTQSTIRRNRVEDE